MTSRNGKKKKKKKKRRECLSVGAYIPHPPSLFLFFFWPTTTPLLTPQSPHLPTTISLTLPARNRHPYTQISPLLLAKLSTFRAHHTDRTPSTAMTCTRHTRQAKDLPLNASHLPQKHQASSPPPKPMPKLSYHHYAQCLSHQRPIPFAPPSFQIAPDPESTPARGNPFPEKPPPRREVAHSIAFSTRHGL